MKRKKQGQKNIGFWGGLLICLLSAAVIFSNLFVIYRFADHQTEELGNTKLSQISHELQMTLDDSKIMLLRFASDVEVFMERGESKEEIQSYLKSQSRIFRDQSNNTLMNAYICAPDWILISDSKVPDNYDVTGRDWYAATLKSGIDNIYTTAPYVDAFTDEMCFTTAVLLPDGKTVAAIDFNLEKIQKTIADMNSEADGEALIVSRDGIIVGYMDNDYVGKNIEAVLPEYTDVYNRLLNGHSDSFVFETTINGAKSKIFSNRSGEWLLLYKAGSAVVLKKEFNGIWISIVLSLILLGGMFVFFLSVNRNRIRAEETFAAYKTIKQEQEKTEEKQHNFKDALTLTKGARNGIMTIMLVAIAVAVIFTSLVMVRWGRDRMEREVDSYNHHLEKWTTTQLQTLNMFVDTIAANSSVIYDYDFAVDYLDKIVKNYPEISAAYIARPGAVHEMTMNNGWVPNSDYVVGKRQWFVDTMRAYNGINISAPYLDARTGLYCVTFSRVVFEKKTGMYLGVFALDFYTENLTSIMESSYSGTGYAFLVDSDNIIINHPNADYRISETKSTNIIETEYAKLLDNDSIQFIRDYDGKIKACISRREETTGFTVVSVKNAYTIYGFVLLSGLIFIVLLVTCIILLYKLIMRMIKWQEEVRQTLAKEADRASKADRAKSNFLAQMSHEIRTPINAVLGMNEMILRETKEEAVAEYATNAYNAGKALLSIINDILDISKIEAGKLEIVNADYDLYSLVSDCYNLTADRAQKKGLNFTYSVESRLPTKLNGDMFHIRQIVVNYITNAIKYTDEGSINLVVAGIKDEDGFSLKISVQDTGIGLTKESQQKLFESFQRFDLKRNQSVEGTGLGLSICKQLAEIMGGEVFVDSEYGKGSTFGCRIPQTIVDESPVGEMILSQQAGFAEGFANKKFTAENARILVVDDVDMNITVFKSLVKEHRMKIDSALSGSRCLEMVQKQKYDLIFMDHMMPEMDGMETYARMKETEHQNKDTPVIMLTANAILGEKEKYLNAGFASYLTKPIQSDKLVEALIEYLPKELIIWEETEADDTEPAGEIQSVMPPENSRDAVDPDILNTELGLSYAGSSEEAYLMILDSYVERGSGNMEKIRTHFEEEDWENYVIAVHALKSTSLTVGAEKLSKAAAELEAAGKAGDYGLIKEKHAALTDLYEKVLAAGEQLLDRGKKENTAGEQADPSGKFAGESQEITEEKLLELRESIQKATTAFDDDELDAVFEEISSYTYHGANLAEKLAGVKMLAGDFEYKDAGILAEKLFEELLKTGE